MLTLVRNACIYNPPLKGPQSPLLLDLCPNLHNCCIPGGELDSLIPSQDRKRGTDSVGSCNLDITLQSYPLKVHLYTSMKFRTLPVATAVTHLRLPVIAVGANIWTQAFVPFFEFFQSLKCLALPIDLHQNDVYTDLGSLARVNDLKQRILKSSPSSLFCLNAMETIYTTYARILHVRYSK
jgi:hypothetical protein